MQRLQNIDSYVGLAMRTLAADVAEDKFKMDMNACTGLSSETGEINEIMKKHYFHGHEINQKGPDHLKKELGDLMWYFALMCWSNNLVPSEILALNIKKLEARYPDGFATEYSINRKENDI
jgi:NTP pyrophosphatase (non-canonical NTP hydrolase)